MSRVFIARLASFAVLLLAITTVARAQDAPPPYLAVVEGSVSIDRQGEVEAAVSNMPLIPGDRVTTTRGRAEVLFPDGSALDIDEQSTITLLTPIRLSLDTGRAIFVVPADVNRQYATRYEIDTPSSTIVTGGFGTYRADASSSAGTWPPDSFDRWAEARYGDRVASVSGQYLPQDLRVYGGTLDRAGSWQYDTSYGYVWYPSVAASWRPYDNGFWEPIPRYGWTWIGADVWSWPTHHYGRWGYSRARWFWIPGRTFGPAWVSWGAADGYVGWCPLGFDNRPVFGLSVGLGYPSSGWVVVPRTTFGSRHFFANRYASVPHRIPPHTAFIVQSVPPVAVPRDTGRRAALDSAPRTESGAGVRSRANSGGMRPSDGIGYPRASGAVAVPRNGVAPPQTAPVTAPQASGGGPSSAVAQPRFSTPAFRRTDTSRTRTGTDRGRGSIPIPDQRRSVPDVARESVPVPGAVPRMQPTVPSPVPSAPSPPATDTPRFRTPATMYGVPPRNPGTDAPRFRTPDAMHGMPPRYPTGGMPPASVPQQVVPRAATPAPIAPPPSVAPMPRAMAPASAPAVAVPRATAPAPASPPAAAPPPQPPPTRSGGGENRAQPRHRGQER